MPAPLATLRVTLTVERQPLVDAALDLIAVSQHALDALPAHEAQPVRDRLAELARVFTAHLAVQAPPTKPSWKPESSSAASRSKPPRKRRPKPEK